MNSEAPASPEHVNILRKDYQPPDYWVREVALDVALDPAATRVRAVLSVERNGTHDRPLRLAGDGLEPVAVRVDGGAADWSIAGDMLRSDGCGCRCRVRRRAACRRSTAAARCGRAHAIGSDRAGARDS